MNQPILLYGVLCAGFCLLLNMVLLPTVFGSPFLLLEGGVYAGSIALGMRAAGIALSRTAMIEFVALAEIVYLGLLLAPLFNRHELYFLASGIGTALFLCLCGVYAVPVRRRVWHLFAIAIAGSPFVHLIVFIGVVLLLISVADSSPLADNALVACMILSVQCATTYAVHLLYKGQTGAPEAVPQEALLNLGGTQCSTVAKIFRISAFVLTTVVFAAFLLRLFTSPVLARLVSSRHLRHSYSVVTIFNPFEQARFSSAIARAVEAARADSSGREYECLYSLVGADRLKDGGANPVAWQILDIQHSRMPVPGKDGTWEWEQSHRVFVRFILPAAYRDNRTSASAPVYSGTAILYFSEPDLVYKWCSF